jgi:hypothetical protein
VASHSFEGTPRRGWGVEKILPWQKRNSLDEERRGAEAMISYGVQIGDNECGWGALDANRVSSP